MGCIHTYTLLPKVETTGGSRHSGRRIRTVWCKLSFLVIHTSLPTMPIIPKPTDLPPERYLAYAARCPLPVTRFPIILTGRYSYLLKVSIIRFCSFGHCRCLSKYLGTNLENCRFNCGIPTRYPLPVRRLGDRITTNNCVYIQHQLSTPYFRRSSSERTSERTTA